MAREMCALVLLIVVAVPYMQAVPTTEHRCGACMENLSGFRDALLEHMTLEDLSDLSEMCEIFPMKSRAACRSLLTPHPLPGSEMLLAGLCDAASMCSLPSEDMQDDEAMYFRSEQDLFEPETDLEVDEEEDVDGVFLCSICQKVMRIGHSFLTNKARRGRVLNMIKALCKFVPFFRYQCSNLVRQYGSLVLDLMSNFINPHLCKTVGLCRREGVSRNGPSGCRTCEMVTGLITDTLADPFLATRIQLISRVACSTVLPEAREKCEVTSRYMTEELLRVVKEVKKSSINFSALCQEYSFCGPHGSD